MLILAKISVLDLHQQIEHTLDFSWLFHENLILKTKLHCSSKLYIDVKKYFQPFFGIFGTQNRKIRLSFGVHEGLKIKK